MGSSDFGAEIGFLVLAVNALLFVTLRSVTWDDDVTDFDSGDSFSYAFDDACGLMTEDAWEFAFGIASIKSVDIGVAEGIGDNFDSDFALLGRVNEDLFDDEGLFGLVGDSGLAKDGFAFEGLHRERYD